MSFLCQPVVADLELDYRHGPHPTVVRTFAKSQLELPAGGTHFGFVQQGELQISCPQGRFALSGGMYFSLPDSGHVQGSGTGMVISRIGYHGFFQIGGPIENCGRLRYIDGCTDSLLIAPVLRGDPCLNLLHIPPATNQTSHTHPSIRVGMVVSGQGLCRTLPGDTPLTPGSLFVIPTNDLHSFHTHDRPLLIVAWHPDSDFGPTHAEHPMINRTLVDGMPYQQPNEDLHDEVPQM